MTAAHRDDARDPVTLPAGPAPAARPAPTPPAGDETLPDLAGPRPPGPEARAAAASDPPTDSPPAPSRGPGPPPAAPPPPVPAAEPAGQPFGRYRLLERLGHGGMGLVYRAWDTELKRVVALKMLLAEDGVNDQAVERFLREARAAARLHHPGIVPVHDVGTCDGRHYFTMDCIEGESLEAARRQLPPRRFLEILREVALALHVAHQAGVVHRDVKPANILLDAAGHPYVSDFGLAKELRPEGGSAITVSGAVMGTPYYMSPEQANGETQTIGPGSDVWSLGVILYEHLAGRKPFAVDNTVQLILEILTAEPEPPSRVAGRTPGARRVHRDLETIALKCLEKDPDRRYASAADLAADLGRFLDGEPIQARPVSWLARTLRRAVKHRLRVALAAAAVGLLVLVGAYVRSAQRGVAASDAERRKAEAARAAAEAERAQAQAEREVEQILGRAEALWREARFVLRLPDIPLARYHEKIAAATRLYDEALARAPHYGWTLESRGRLRLQTNDLGGAEEDFAAALRLLGPERGKAVRRSLAMLYLERSLIALYPGIQERTDVLRKLSQEWRARADAEFAAAAGATEWRGVEEEAKAARRLAEGFAAWWRGDRALTLQLLRAGIEEDGDEECAWALSLFTPRSESDAWLEKALKMRPRFARALFHRAARRRAGNQLDAAAADYSEAIGIDPRFALAFNGRAAVRYHLDDWDGAIEDYSQAIRIDPKFAHAWFNRGLVYQGRMQLDLALADLRKALEFASPTGALREETNKWIRLNQLARFARPAHAPAGKEHAGEEPATPK